MDVNFYLKHYKILGQFPEKFIDTQFKNQTIVVWKDSTQKQDFHANWSHTLTYDQHARVIQYSYSGCILCATLPYDMFISYDSFNRVVKIERYHPVADAMAKPVKQAFETTSLTYAPGGYIKKIELYYFGDLKRRITQL